MKKLDKKYLFAFVILFSASVLFPFFKVVILEAIKYVAISKHFILIITVAVFLVSILHKIKFKEIAVEDFTSIKRVKEVFSEIISTVTEPSTFVCSIAIIKGLFLDYFFKDNYFFKFNDAEKTFLFIASFYFLTHTFIEIKVQAIELFADTASIEDPSEDE